MGLVWEPSFHKCLKNSELQKKVQSRLAQLIYAFTSVKCAACLLHSLHQRSVLIRFLSGAGDHCQSKATCKMCDPIQDFRPKNLPTPKIPFPKVRCKVMLARNWETNFMTLGALTLHPAGTTLARHSCTAAHTAVTSVTLRPEWIFKVVHFLYKHCSRISSIRVMPITYSSLAKQHGEIEVPKTFEAIGY